MKKFYLVCLTLLSFGLSADVTVEKMSEIESRVDSMSLSELQDRRSFLKRRKTIDGNSIKYSKPFNC